MFGSRCVDDLVAEWQFENYAWLIDQFSTGAGLPDSELWQPIPEHFKLKTSTGHIYTGRKLVKTIFDTLIIQCGFSKNHNIKLSAAQESKDKQVGETTFVRTLSNAACGRYVAEPVGDGNWDETIYYDVDLSDSPNDLIATLSHELSHALHYRARDEHVDLDPDLYELFTDLTAIYLGYGLFIANTRFEFSGFQDATTYGWQAKGAGYLPEADIIFALAIFMAIKNIPIEEAQANLKPRLAKLLKKANKQLRRYSDEIQALRARVPKYAQSVK